MRILLIVFLAFLSSCLFNPFALALSDRCMDIEQKTGLDLNEAECYVLEQVEKGEIAHFKVSGKRNADFEERFSKIEDRTLSTDFLKDLLTGTLPNLKVTEGGVRIWNARIKEPLYIRNIRIPFIVSLSDCFFDKRVDFVKVWFDKGVDFMATSFSEEAVFDSAKFSENASFRGATFSGSASFSAAKFFGGAFFLWAKFYRKTSFLSATFSGTASFYETKFSEEVSFGSVTFSGKALFIRAIFSEKVSFRGATFFREASFFEVTFLKEADFPSCNFTSKSNLKNATFNDKVIFDDVSGFSNMVVEWKYSPDKFGYVKDNTTIKLRELKNNLEYNETFYIALIKNYRDMGWFKEADDCYHTYRLEKRMRRPLWAGIPEWAFLEFTFGYGVKPLFLARTFLIFWLPFTFYYLGFVRIHYGQKLPWWKAWNPIFKPSRFLWSLIYSLDTITPGVNFESLKSLKQKVLIKSDSKRILYARRFQQILGWYWAALFLILFSKIWIR